jgi:hypothetical protein
VKAFDVSLDATITGNQVGNAGFDLLDSNASCDANFCSGNVFFTKNEACVN